MNRPDVPAFRPANAVIRAAAPAPIMARTLPSNNKAPIAAPICTAHRTNVPMLSPSSVMRLARLLIGARAARTSILRLLRTTTKFFCASAAARMLSALGPADEVNLSMSLLSPARSTPLTLSPNSFMARAVLVAESGMACNPAMVLRRMSCSLSVARSLRLTPARPNAFCSSALPLAASPRFFTRSLIPSTARSIVPPLA